MGFTPFQNLLRPVLMNQNESECSRSLGTDLYQ
jgi:hypothetical protein